MMNFTRRDFVHAGCSVAAATLVPSIVDRAEAFTHGIAIASSGFNNGKSQAAPWFIGFGDFPFINILKTSSSWNYGSGSFGIPSPAELNSDGYPITIVASTVGVVTGVNCSRSGIYVVDWTGNGTISLGVQTAGATITPNTGYTSANLTSTTGVGRYEFTTTDPAGINLGITVLSSPIIGNLRVYLKSEEAAQAAGQIFGTQFLSVLRAGNPGVLRFLDWTDVNGTNLTTWATRKPTTYFSYAASEYRSGLYAGVTTQNVLKQSATLGTGGPVDKQTIHVRFGAASIGISIGANAQISWTAHNLQVGQAFVFVKPSTAAALVLPTNTATGAALVQSTYNGTRQVYWVSNVVDANTFNFASTNGGSNITTSGTLTGSPLGYAYCQSQTVTVSSANPGVVTLANHGMSAGAAVSIATNNSNGLLPNGHWNSQIFYVSAANLTTGSFQFALTPGGTDIDMTGRSGTFTCIPCATFNLNGTGDVPLLSPWGDPISGSNSPFASTNGLTATLVYDADLNGWLKFGSDSGGAEGLLCGIPPEISIALCVAIGANPHYPAPYLACDPMTDWHIQLATYIKTSAPSWMKPRFEGTNETWNSALGFYATRYAWNKSPVHWGQTFYQSNDDWYGKIISTIGQDINAVYGGTPGTQTNYAVIDGIQTTSAQPNGIFANATNPRYTSAQYVAQAAAAQSTYATGSPPTQVAHTYIKDPAYNWGSHVCVANYWGPGQVKTPMELINAYNYCVTNSGNPTGQAAVTTNFLNSSNSGCNFTGSLGSSVLTVTAFSVGDGNLLPGSVFFNVANTVSSVKINSQLTGSPGSTGTYSISSAATVVSGALFSTGAINGAAAATELVAVKRFAVQASEWVDNVSSGLITRMCGYEGGYSPDYPSSGATWTSVMASVSAATNAVITVGNSTMESGTTTGAAAVVGMPVTISGVTGSMSGINTGAARNVTVTAGSPGNVLLTAHGFSSGQSFFFDAGNTFISQLPVGAIFGQTYYVATVVDANNFTFSATSGGSAINLTGAQVNTVSCTPCQVVTAVTSNGNGTITSFAVNFDSTGLSATGGVVAYGAAFNLVTYLRKAAKFDPTIQGFTTQLYNDFVAAGGEFPSCYVIAGANAVWPVWDPNIYISTPPQWAAIEAFNN